MTAYWVYDLPNWVLAILVVSIATQLGVFGLFITRPLVGRLVAYSGKHNDIISYTFTGVGVFYGLTLGLIAVATWQNFTTADGLVTKEAALIEALYCDIDGYPQPTRDELERRLYSYVQQTIAEEWPAHRRGKVLEAMTQRLDEIQNVVMAFSPRNDREKLIHNQVIRSMDAAQSQRQLRIQAVPSGLPAVLWFVLLAGAVITFVPTWLFRVDNLPLHAILVGVQGLVLGLLIFLTAAMDNPFRGDFSISADAFEQVFSRMLKPGATLAALDPPHPDTGTTPRSAGDTPPADAEQPPQARHSAARRPLRERGYLADAEAPEPPARPRRRAMKPRGGD